MKAAEEWFKILGGFRDQLPIVGERDIAAIQLDAYKQGMTDAAKIVNDQLPI